MRSPIIETWYERRIKGRSASEMPQIDDPEVVKELERMGYASLGEYAYACFKEDLRHTQP